MKPGLFVATLMTAWACCGFASAEETAPLVCARKGGAWTKVSGPEGKDCDALKHKDSSVPIAKTCGLEGDCSVEVLLPANDDAQPLRLKVRKGAAGASQATEKGGIEDIRAQFFYRTTGILSQNVAPPLQFSIHNAIIGEGQLEEPSDDLLVSVFLSKLHKDIISDCNQTLTVVVTDDKNNTLLHREFESPSVEIPQYKKIVNAPMDPPPPTDGKHLLKAARAVLFSNFPSGRVKIEAMFGDELLAIWLFFGSGG